MQSEVTILQRKVKLRGFSLDKLIGTGAFAKVYVCRKNFSRKKYAAKSVEYGGDHKLKWETENEIEVLQQLNHRNVVRLHGVLREKGHTILILDYIHGPTFLEGVLSWPHFCEKDAKIVMKQLLSALEFCHMKRTVHRDISPENVMWCDVPSSVKPHATPWLKLIDFNLARSIPEHSNYLQADPLGNPSYMAPECLQETPMITFATDIWAVGVILYTLLAGYPPFWNDNYNHLLQNITEANFAMPESLWSHTSQEGQNMIQRMLRKNITDRPTASELLSCKWFQTVQNTRSSEEWIGHSRLIIFLNHLSEKRKRKTHRNYTLTFTERKAFIPEASMITFQCNADENNNNMDCSTNLNNNKMINTHQIKSMIAEIKTHDSRISCHW